MAADVGRWWGKIKVEDRIREDETVTSDNFASALISLCEHFDLTKPIVTGKHQHEMENFRRTVFYPDDFIEDVCFDTFEIEKIVTKKQPK